MAKLTPDQKQNLRDAQIDLHRILENGKRINRIFPTDNYIAGLKPSPIKKVLQDPMLKNAIAGYMFEVGLDILANLVNPPVTEVTELEIKNEKLEVKKD